MCKYVNLYITVREKERRMVTPGKTFPIQMGRRALAFTIFIPLALHKPTNSAAAAAVRVSQDKRVRKTVWYNEEERKRKERKVG